MKPSAKCLRRGGGIRRGGRRGGCRGSCRRRRCRRRRVGRSGGWLTRRDAEGVRFGGAPVLLFLLAPAGGRCEHWLQLRALRTARAVPPGLAPSFPRDVVPASGPAEVTAPACASVARCGCQSRAVARCGRQSRAVAPCGLRHFPLALTEALLASLLPHVSALLPRLNTLEVSAHVCCRVRGGSASHPTSRSGDLLSAAVPMRRVRFRSSSRRDLFNRLDLFLRRRGSHIPSALVQHKGRRPVATLCCRLRRCAGGFSSGGSHRKTLVTQRAGAQCCADGGDSQRTNDRDAHNPHVVHIRRLGRL